MCRSWNFRCSLLFCFLIALAAQADPPFFSKKKEQGPKNAEFTEAYWSEPVAKVNDVAITRGMLAKELFETYAEKHIDNMVKRKLIEQACAKASIVITKEDLEADLKAELESLNMTIAEYKKILASQDTTLEVHLRDNVWPKVALTRLVSGKVKVTEEDIQKGFEASFGEKVDVRLLVLQDPHQAFKFWQQINDEKVQKKRLELFEQIAKDYSSDQATRPYGGRCQPINKYSSLGKIEEAAFKLQPGEMSQILDSPDGGKLLMLCVQRIPPQTEFTLDTPINQDKKMTVRTAIEKNIYQKKLMFEMGAYVNELQKNSKIDNYMTVKVEGKSPAPPAAAKGRETPPVGN